MEQNNQNPLGGGQFFGNISPIKIFVFGLIQGLLVLCTIGFFILLPMVIGGASVARAPSANLPSNNNFALPEEGQPSGPIVVRPVDEKNDHIRGNKNAKITIIEYSDFECPFCARFQPTIEQALDTYPNDVRVVYRHFPLSFHPQAVPAAVASECAADQGKFWEYHDELFARQTSLSGGETFYKSLAKELKLNEKRFADCLVSGKYEEKVNSQLAEGPAAGVGGTPHSIVLGPNGEQLPVSGAQPFAVVDGIIRQLLGR